MRIRDLAVLGLLLVGGATLASSPAWAHAPDPSSSGAAWPQDTTLTFRWRSGAEPPAAIKSAIRDAAADVNATRASRAATFAYGAGAANPIGYGPGATCGVNGIACYTRTAPDGGFTMWLREHGRVFDWGTLRWCQLSLANGCYDAETIALDEFGHVEGLDHHGNYADERDYTDAVVQTFSRTRPREGWDMHWLGRCDVATLQMRYDVPLASSTYSTCLDLDTVLTIAASPTSIAYDASATVTATLRVVDAAAYGRVGGNAVSGRTVRLQRRQPGTTTWTTIATMAPGPTTGSYVASVRLITAAEFRAVFATPTTEGLNGDTSGTVTVAVGACTGTLCPQSLPGR